MGAYSSLCCRCAWHYVCCFQFFPAKCLDGTLPLWLAAAGVASATAVVLCTGIFICRECCFMCGVYSRCLAICSTVVSALCCSWSGSHCNCVVWLLIFWVGVLLCPSRILSCCCPGLLGHTHEHLSLHSLVASVAELHAVRLASCFFLRSQQCGALISVSLGTAVGLFARSIVDCFPKAELVGASR